LAEAKEARELQHAAEHAVEEQRKRIQQLGREVCDVQDLVIKLSDERKAAEERARSATDQAEKLERRNRSVNHELLRLQGALGGLHRSEREARSELAVRLDELAEVTRSLVEQEEKLRWIREVHTLLYRTPWWWAMLPQRLRRQREQRRLKRAGLFDAQSYLQERPDVREFGLDPLRHYVSHGMDEAMPNLRFWAE
jgi:chromosome segregation ATPase